MRHQKRFWQGALCGALAVLLGLGLVSCAGSLPFLGKEEAVSQETKEKLSGIQALIQTDLEDPGQRLYLLLSFWIWGKTEEQSDPQKGL